MWSVKMSIVENVHMPMPHCLSGIRRLDSSASRRRRAVNPLQVIACVCETSRPRCKFNTGSRDYLLHRRWLALARLVHLRALKLEEPAWPHCEVKASGRNGRGGLSQSQAAFKGFFCMQCLLHIMNYPWLQNRSLAVFLLHVEDCYVK